MLEFEDARSRMLQLALRLPSERLSVAAASGRVLAEDVIAPADLPAADTSAMDGYAVCAAQLPPAGPWRLPVHGESRAGHPTPGLEPGHACRIFTGAVLPFGADSVLLQENVQREGEWLTFTERPPPGDHVRPRGQDIARGALALTRGTRLNAFCLGALAAVGRHEVRVSTRPRVSILCTGDELFSGSPQPAAGSGAIFESNGMAIAALARAAGASAQLFPLLGDDAEQTRASLDSALAHSDVVFTTGGVSVGDHDVVRQALDAVGAQTAFWKVRIKPGKPLVVAQRAGCLVLGLPGNPVSAQVTFCLFGAPLLRQMQGDARPIAPKQWGTLTRAVQQKPGRLGLLRARLEGDALTPLDNQSSGSAFSLAHADALLFFPEDKSELLAGTRVEYSRLDLL